MMQMLFSMAMQITQLTAKSLAKTVAVLLSIAIKGLFISFSVSIKLLEVGLDAAGRIASVCTKWLRTAVKRFPK